MKRTRLALVATALVLLSLAAWGLMPKPSTPPAAHKPTAATRAAGKQAAAKAPPPRLVKIDLDRAVAVDMPAAKAGLEAVAFRTPDGKAGWALRIPGDRPIATPAYADGRLFVGGGYGSHEFYAFDAATGKLAWQMKTSDDGPTAAVVEDGCVAFNTESCTVIVTDAKTGKVLWQEWLGDPLMSQPAIWKGRLYIAFPAGQRGQSQAPNGGGQVLHSAVQHAPANQKPAVHAPTNQAAAAVARPGRPYRMLCADLRTGRHLWVQSIPADVISAPVVEDARLFLTCFDGTSFSLDALTGKVIWEKKNAGTSAPVVVGRDVIVTEKEQRGSLAYEGMKRLDAARGAAKDARSLASGKAGYLSAGGGGGVALGGAAQKSLDSSVGFATPPASAQLGAAQQHLGVNTVVGGWAYQGARAAYGGGQMMNAQGRYLNAVGYKGGRLNWRAEAGGKGLGADEQVFSPPALGKQNLYLCSARGHVLSVRQKDGKVGFLYALKQPMAFQPALAGGSVYVGTANGMLICLKTGSRDADGWTAWGGNAQHNRKL